MASWFTEEESSLEEPIEFTSVRSSILQSVRSQSQIYDSENTSSKLTDMLITVNSTLERIDDVILCCRLSFYSGQVEDCDISHPQRVRDKLIELRTLLSDGLSFLEQLYTCSNEIYKTIGNLIMYDIELPELSEFDLPHGSLMGSFSRIISLTSVETIVGTLTSKQCLINLVNIATNHVMVMRNFTRTVTHLYEQCCVEVMCSRVSNLINHMKDDMENCIGKIIEFGKALECSQVKAKLKSANSILEIAINSNPSRELSIVKTILETHEQFQISFENFCMEDFNQDKSLEEIWSEVENNSLSTGLIYPIISVLNCSPPVAWRILKLLHMRNARRNERYISTEPKSICSDNGLD
ncbi:hypothetical protein LOD99_2983 [Oopsacas minuta]|uniref:Uncharacterized protein n=1 Tax=Oopsacas minuta TaxID=111878 RepID=A0AAV7JYM7_9METZ|nr:hypothetical protein LOD99_2983 [Oopsacas minuta]